jgi:hypothetical protein
VRGSAQRQHKEGRTKRPRQDPPVTPGPIFITPVGRWLCVTTGRPRRWPRPIAGFPRALFSYLVELQRLHRPSDRPFPNDARSIAEEARRGLFNADHVQCILVGRAGPWDAEGVPPVNLLLVLNALRRRRAAEPLRQQQRATWGRFNRKLNSLITHVRTSHLAPDVTARILGELAAERLPLHSRPLVTARGELAWLAPLAVNLSEYLTRTTGRIEGDVVFREAACILAFASGHRVTRSMVKDRVLRARKLK